MAPVKSMNEHGTQDLRHSVDSITVLSPNSTSSWRVGSTETINWTWEGDFSFFMIHLYKNDEFIDTLYIGEFTVGSWDWEIDPLVVTDYPRSDYQIMIEDVDETVSDFGDYFEIKGEKSLTIYIPDSGSRWQTGTTENIVWTSTGSISSVKIELLSSETLVETLTDSVTNTNSFAWDIPLNLASSTDYQIRISDASDDSINDTSEFFEIYSPSINSLTIVTPSEGSSWLIGSTEEISWEATGGIESVTIQLYREDTQLFTIVSPTINDGTYNWTVQTDLEESSDYRIRIEDYSDSSVFDYSDYFEIYQQNEKQIVIVNPNSTDIWETGNEVVLHWTSTGNISNVKIELYLNNSHQISISESAINIGTYNWSIPTNLSNSTLYQIKLMDTTDNSTYAFSDYFKIVNVQIEPNGNGGEHPEIDGFNFIIFISSLVSLVFLTFMTFWKIRRKNRNNLIAHEF